MTYSFPCQDLSLAGKGAGMEKGSGTRSGLLWEIERILTECKEKPQILLMENVTQVHGSGNGNHFKEWQLRLEEMGYQSYWQDISATDFGIPQTRNRTFMISILGNYNFKFPKKTELKLRLKNLLEPEETIKENYYLSESMIDYVSATDTENFNNCDSKVNKKIARPLTTEQNKRAGTTNYIADDLPEETDLSKIRGTKNRAEVLLNLLNANGELEKYDLPNGCDSSLNNPKIREVSNTITTRYDAGIQNQQQIGMCVVEKVKKINNKNLMKTLESNDLDKIEDVGYVDAYNKNIITNGTAKTILTGVDFRNQDFIAIKNASKKGYLLAEEGDGVDISSRMEFHRGNVKKGLSQTITTFGENNGVVVSLKRGYSVEVKKEQEQANNVDYIGNYSKSNFNQTAIVGKNGLAPTVTENHGQVTAINIADLRLRKLTPKECFRLMGLKDEDIDLIMENQTNASGYHLAGDSIVTTCLMAIFGKLLGIDWQEKFNPKEWWK